MDNRYRHTGRIAVWQRGFAITWDVGHFGAFFVPLFLGFTLFNTWLRLPPHLTCPAVADDKYDKLRSVLGARKSSAKTKREMRGGGTSFSMGAPH